MNPARAAGLVAVLASLVLAPTASAAVKAKVALVRATNGVQIEVRLRVEEAVHARDAPARCA